ncbi:MAG: hypothetical protein Q8Q01_02855 [archaeon]|nr:hypothetical protein [archaeon]
MEEIHTTHHEKTSGHTEKKISKETAILYVLIGITVILLIFSITQAFALNSLQQNLFGSVLSGGGSATVQSSVPAMVGGC